MKFTLIGWVIVFLFLMFFIRTKAVAWLLGILLLGMLLLNYQRILPILTTKAGG